MLPNYYAFVLFLSVLEDDNLFKPVKSASLPAGIAPMLQRIAQDELKTAGQEVNSLRAQ